MDNKNFYGGLLHCFYVPELETIAETRAKLANRQKEVLLRIKKNLSDPVNPDLDKFIPGLVGMYFLNNFLLLNIDFQFLSNQYHRKKRTPALPLTKERLTKHYPGQTFQSIYKGIPQDIDPRSSSIKNALLSSKNVRLPTLHGPIDNSKKTIEECPSTSKNYKLKRKNYKGQSIDDNVKSKVLRPQIVDTTRIIDWNNDKDKTIFSNVKKVESGITIRLTSKECNEKKRIIIKDPRYENEYNSK